MKVAKWGFGIAPLKDTIAYRNKIAVAQVLRYVEGKEVVGAIEDHLSHLKGMFNRIIRQDQWDWFTVNMYFDYPSTKELSFFVSTISKLRRAVIDCKHGEIQEIIKLLTMTNFKIYMENYKNHDKTEETSDQYIYILSRKEENELLKIGMTTRNVIKRCNEINSSTGVVFPFSPRKAIRVSNAADAEKAVHNALKEYRIRSDREFFLLDYKKAVQIIEEVLYDNNFIHYKYEKNLMS